MESLHDWFWGPSATFDHLCLALKEQNGRTMAFHFHRNNNKRTRYEAFSHHINEDATFLGSTMLGFEEIDTKCRQFVDRVTTLGCQRWTKAFLESACISLCNSEDKSLNQLYEVRCKAYSSYSAVDEVGSL